MAVSTFDVERRAAKAAETIADLQNTRMELLTLSQRLDRHDTAIGRTTIVAYAAAVVGGVFGLVDFALLLQVIGRLH